MSKNSKGYLTSGGERASYGLYFLGQNIFYMLIYSFLSTYYQDAGIAAAAVAGVVLAVKIWDAVNDPIFGGLMDRFHFKKGTFVPWLRISLIGIPISTILMFAIPSGIPMGGKIAWAVVTYMLWDTAYTICDVPIFGLVTTMTDVQNERTSLNAIGRVCAMIAAAVVFVSISSVREKLGGWTLTVVVLSLIALVTMIPICFKAKERISPKESEKEKEYSVVDIFRYLKTNKYLAIYYGAFLISGTLAVATQWTLYIGRFILNDESKAGILSIMAILPAVLIGPFVPKITRKVDKFKLYYIATICTVVLTALRFFIGYRNINLYMAFMVIGMIPAGITTVLMYMFTPDCAEYGHYKTGHSMPGITFAAQTFFVKLQAALATSLASAVLAWIGFNEGEGAVQAAGFTDKFFNASIWLPVAGGILSLILLHFYRLNDKDVEIMAKCNAGEITRETAERSLSRKY